MIDEYFTTLKPTELSKFYKIWPIGWNIGDTRNEVTFVKADFSLNIPVFTFSYQAPEPPDPPDPPNPDPIPDHIIQKE